MVGCRGLPRLRDVLGRATGDQDVGANHARSPVQEAGTRSQLKPMHGINERRQAFRRDDVNDVAIHVTMSICPRMRTEPSTPLNGCAMNSGCMLGAAFRMYKRMSASP